MNTAKIISGKYKDAWPADDAPSPVNDDGSVNWGAAFRADPGVRKCPGCDHYYWNEAKVMECPACEIQFGDGVATPNTEEAKGER
jgi:hypothetical protein